MKLRLGILLLYIIATQADRYVLTFVNSSVAEMAGHLEPMDGTSVIKQYGRRLVLSIYNDSIVEEKMINYYGGAPNVLTVEKDLMITSNSIVVGQADFIDSLTSEAFSQYIDIQYRIKAMSGDLVSLTKDSIYQQSTSWGLTAMDPSTLPDGPEWQYASDSPYGTNAEKLWQFTNGTLETRIALLDSGIAEIALNESWFENVEEGYDFISDPDISLDGDGRDSISLDPGDEGPLCPKSSWHGTKMAYAIAGKHNAVEGVRSMAWNTTIQPLRVLGLCKTGYVSDVADAIVWAAGGLINGMGHNPQPAKVISMSFGGTGKCPSFLQSVISMAKNEYGVTLFAAAGNQASRENNVFPANCLGVISIGASTYDGKITFYTNMGRSLAILAPGGNSFMPIRTIDLGLDQDNQTVSSIAYSWGTSFSCAFTSGFFSLNFHIFNSEFHQNNKSYEHTLRRFTRNMNTDDEYSKWMCTAITSCGSGILNVNLRDLDLNTPIQNDVEVIPLLDYDNKSNQIVYGLNSECPAGTFRKLGILLTEQCTALYCPTSQSSTSSPYGPQNAINGLYTDYTYTSGAAGEKPWWRVDLESARTVETIKVVFHSSMGRYSDLQVWIGNNSTSFNGIGNSKCFDLNASVFAVHTIPNCNGNYRYLYIYRDVAATSLILAEVEIYGVSEDLCKPCPENSYSTVGSTSCTCNTGYMQKLHNESVQYLTWETDLQSSEAVYNKGKYNMGPVGARTQRQTSKKKYGQASLRTTQTLTGGNSNAHSFQTSLTDYYMNNGVISPYLTYNFAENNYTFSFWVAGYGPYPDDPSFQFISIGGFQFGIQGRSPHFFLAFAEPRSMYSVNWAYGSIWNLNGVSTQIRNYCNKHQCGVLKAGGGNDGPCFFIHPNLQGDILYGAYRVQYSTSWSIWTHVTLTSEVQGDYIIMKMYLDGIPADCNRYMNISKKLPWASRTFQNATIGANSVLNIYDTAAMHTATVQDWYIDDYQFFKTALSQSEVVALRNKMLVAPMCVACAPSLYCSAGTTLSCPYNRKSPAMSTSITQCTQCLGLTTNFANTESCSSCLPKYFPIGNEQCRNCTAGSICFNGTNEEQCAFGTFSLSSASVCTSCISNANSSLGSTNCTCNPSYFLNNSVCVACLNGSYCPGNDKMYACPNNTWSLSLASTVKHCNFCRVGFIYNDTDMCRACTPGMFCLNSTKETNCSIGLYSLEMASACTVCPVSTYNAWVGASTCISCGNNASTLTTASVALSNCSCNGGFYHEGLTSDSKSHNCTACVGGTFSTGIGMTSPETCTDCRVGTFSTGGFSSCAYCPSRTWNDFMKATVCYDCPSGSIGAGPGLTSAEAACLSSCPSPSVLLNSSCVCPQANSLIVNGACQCRMGFRQSVLGVYGENFEKTCNKTNGRCLVTCRATSGCSSANDGSDGTFYRNDGGSGWVQMDLEYTRYFSHLRLGLEGGAASENNAYMEFWAGENATQITESVINSANKLCHVNSVGAPWGPLRNQNFVDIALSSLCKGRFFFVKLTPYGAVRELWLHNKPTCSSCSTGTYNDEYGTTVCKNCLVGASGPFLAQTSCVDCKPGQFSKLNASATCSGCGMGAYSISSKATRCIRCDPGFYTNILEPTMCKQCPANSWNNSASSSCTIFRGYYGSIENGTQICPASFYCPEGSSSPIPCPNNYKTRFEASFHINNCSLFAPETCPPGLYCYDYKFTFCRQGAYCPGGPEKDCPSGTFNNGTGSLVLSNCSKCFVNNYCPQRSILPLPCPSRTISLAGATSLHDCRCIAGYFCLYSKSVAAVISLGNVSLNDFNQDIGGIRTTFINAIAKAAGVDPSRVKIANVTLSSFRNQTTTRRLLALNKDIKTPTQYTEALRIAITIQGGSHHSLAKPTIDHLYIRSHFSSYHNIFIEEWNIEYDLKISKIRS